MFVVKNVNWAIPNGSCFKDTNSGIWVFTILGEGYVIRWAYFVLTDRIAKDRKSRCRSTVAGRVRCAYFFWQGNDCSVNEKGAAAIMAVELDEEKGPQVRCPAPPTPKKVIHVNVSSVRTMLRGGSRERVQGVCTPPWDDLWLSNTTGILY